MEYVVCMGKMRNLYRAMVGKPEGNRPLGRNRCEDNIKVNLD
jgi:hypothetical protein